MKCMINKQYFSTFSGYKIHEKIKKIIISLRKTYSISKLRILGLVLTSSFKNKQCRRHTKKKYLST